MEGEYEMSRKNKSQEETSATSEIENDAIWDKGTRDGDSTEEEEGKEMPPLLSLSEKLRIEEDNSKSDNGLVEWELENCQPVIINKIVGKYSVPISGGLLATMANDLLLHYNEKTQRGKKLRAKGEVPYLMVSKVKKIYEKLISGELNGMLISLNSRIIKNENGEILNPLNYDSDSQTLNGSGELDVVDGWHRISACQYWLKKWKIKKNRKIIPSPWDYEFITAIEHKEEENAGLLFVEYGSTQLKIQTSKIKFLDVFDYANMITRNLMKGSLRDKIEIDKNRTKGTNNIVTFATLNDAINDNFKIPVEEDVEKISTYLNLFFTKLINIFPEYFGNMSKEDRSIMRTKDLNLELLMFRGYVAISSRLYGKENWEDSLSKLRSVIQIGSWRGTILQSDCPIWDRIFRGGDERKIVSGSTTVKYCSNVLGDYIEFGIDETLRKIKEADEEKFRKLNK